MLRQRTRQTGDTLIEVLFAVTVFSLVVVTALSLMNQGTAASQRALEMSLVTQEIENQAETLRFLHEAYVTNYQPGYESTTGLSVAGPTGQFYRIVQRVNATGATQATPLLGVSSCPTPPRGSFVLNTRTASYDGTTAKLQPAQTYAQLLYSTTDPEVLDASRGIWIEGIKSPDVTDPSRANTGFIDFHIRGCWSGPGQSAPLSFGTIVRLYEPRA